METRVRVRTTMGPFTLALDPERAPETVANFLGYVRRGHYDGTIFHRVIPGFVVQGGGFAPGMVQKPTASPIRNEAANGLRNARGTIAMARTADPHSATAQFFINLADNAPLDHREPAGQGWGYAVFGQVVEGMDVVDRIAAVSTRSAGAHQNVPAEDVVVETVAVDEAAG